MEPRLTLLRTVQEGGHPGVEALRQRVIDQIGSVPVQVVYDTVRVLTTADLLHEVRSAGTVTYYETNRNDNHYHVIYRSCGRIEDIPCAREEKPCLHVSHARGYTINEVRVIYHGYCPGRQVKRRKQQTRKSAFAQSERAAIHASSLVNVSA